MRHLSADRARFLVGWWSASVPLPESSVRLMAELPSTNPDEIDTVKRIAQSAADGPVFMLNLNRYRAEAGSPT